MDPTACLMRIDGETRIDSRECREAIADLAMWLAHGGFAPRWEAFPRGSRRFALRCANLYTVEGKGPDTYKPASDRGRGRPRVFARAGHLTD